MLRVSLAALALAAVGLAVAVSRSDAPKASGDAIAIAPGAKNPWTHLKLNRGGDQFQFAVVSDRTGGHRANVFARAVHRLNLLQPEFVVSVGDLIEGYTAKPDVMAKQWDEFDGYVRKLEMPFFYVPGNHDITNKDMAEFWGGRYGKAYYHFVYKNVLFIAVNSEDGKMGNVTPEQAAVVKKACDENPGVKWTLLFVHKPLWTATDLTANGWAGVEAAIAGRKYTVFCGHVHRYQKFVRNGMNYYQLATTGGGSKLRGLNYGEFDHVTLCTMKADGPLLANVMLDGVLPENLELPATDEPGTTYPDVRLFPVSVKVKFGGKPVAGVTVSLHGKLLPTQKERNLADGLTGPDGVTRLSTLTANDGVPAGRYRITVVKTGRGYYDGEIDEKSVLPARYAKPDTSGLTVDIMEGVSELTIELPAQ